MLPLPATGRSLPPRRGFGTNDERERLCRVELNVDWSWLLAVDLLFDENVCLWQWFAYRLQCQRFDNEIVRVARRSIAFALWMTAVSARRHLYSNGLSGTISSVVGQLSALVDLSVLFKFSCYSICVALITTTCNFANQKTTLL